ncbi:histidine kinase [Nonomuraea sp. NPDC050310]|uniref:sensor histidine kinase n=1 Tax=Nonomuraea sp. NPDC050310 TaxID=3154935 RepID=UPI0033C5D2FD
MLRHIPFLRGRYARENAKIVARAREGFARDAHDLVGHWLLLAALRGELACRRAKGDADLHRELTALVEAVQAAAAELRDLTAAYHRVSLAGEASRAGLVLGAMGAACTVRLPQEALSPEVNALLGTILREGVTNLLRHSKATACSIEVTADDEWIRLTVDNDGAPDTSPAVRGGHGLHNLHLRAAELGGRVMATTTGSGTFRLTAEVPAEHAFRHVR